MSYTEVQDEGCLTRLKNAIAGVVFGFIIFVLAFPLTFWNEGRAVKRAQDLAEGKSSVITIDAATVNAENDGKLVHMTAEAVTKETLRDRTFGVTINALRLKRYVEMYQWKEKKETKSKKKVGGGKRKITTYKYSKTWSSSLINSSNFRKPEGRRNPTSMPYNSNNWQAGKVTVGAFRLSTSLVNDINSWSDLPPAEAKNKPSRATVDGSYLFIGSGSLSSPTVGDVRISFKAVTPTTVSFYSKQKGDSFEPYTTANGGTLQRLSVGTHTSKELFEAAEFENTIMTWVLRFVGFFMMWLGIVLILKPFEVMADVIPFLGNLVGAGISLAAFGVAAPLTFITIAIGWIVYRPVIGILLIMVGGAIFVGIYKMASGKKAAAAPGKPSAPPPVPPPIPEG